MPYRLIVEHDAEVPPPPVNKPRVVESPLWKMLRDVEVGQSFKVNRTASHIRGMIAQLHEREFEPEQRRAVKARRYKVKQLDEDNTRVWRLK